MAIVPFTKKLYTSFELRHSSAKMCFLYLYSFLSPFGMTPQQILLHFIKREKFIGKNWSGPTCKQTALGIIPGLNSLVQKISHKTDVATNRGTA